jgi:copper transport protein
VTKRLLVLLLAVASVLMLPAAPAQAHAVLLETAPPAATVLEKAPEAVTLRFNEPVSAALGGVRVLDADGERVEAGRVSRSPDGTTLSVPLENVDDGPYVVAWRVISADSHPLRGAFVFRVGAAGAGDDRDLVSRLLASEKGSPFVGGLFTGVRFAAFGALALLVGGAAFVGLVWPAGAASRRVRRLLVGAWAVALAATLAGLVLQGPYAAGLPLADGLKPSVLADVLSTRFGQVWAARVALLLAAVPLLRALHRFEHGLPRWWAGAGIVLGGPCSSPPAWPATPPPARWWPSPWPPTWCTWRRCRSGWAVSSYW